MKNGTMVHSKYDIDTNEEYITLSIEASEIGDLDENGTSSTKDVVSNAGTTATNISESQITRVNEGRVSLSSNSINMSEVGAIDEVTKKAQQVTVDEFLKAAREMCEYINEVGYDYCVYCEPGKSGNGDTCTCTQACINQYSSSGKCLRVIGSGCDCEANHCKHSVHHNGCDLAPDFESSKESGRNNFCCDRLVKWALQNVGLISKNGGVGGANNLGDYIRDELGAKEIAKGEPLKPGDILCSSGHIEIVGEKKDGAFVQYNGGHEVPVGATEGQNGSSIGLKTEADSWSWAERVLRLPWSQAEEGVYEGFEGNEAVVSPVTGVLIDYGTYNRENVDLKYGPSVKIHLDEDGNVESIEKSDSDNTTQTSTEEFYEPTCDEVGYAVIRVMSKEDFEYLESNISSCWSSLNGGQGLLNESGTFYDEITTEEKLNDLLESTSNSFLAETIYGYKEFAELYSTYGVYVNSNSADESGEEDSDNVETVKKLIAGYTIFIDGFKCELPDENFVDTNDDGSIADEEGIPNGKELTIDSFRISPNNIESENELIQSLYEPAEEYKLASKSATERLNVEERIKSDAYYAMEVGKLIYIKEGTVIGRTFTDREVVENLRDNEKIEDYKISMTKTEAELDSDDYVFEDKLIGNYLNIKMQDAENTTVVENVENYMKLDEAVPEQELDYEFFFWSPYEGGAWGTYEGYVSGYNENAGTRDDVGQGPTIIAVDNDEAEWSIAVGIAQWTNNPGLNNLAGLCKFLGEYDSTLSILSEYGDKDANFFNNNLQAFKDDWHSICSTQEGYNKMVEAQMAYAYEEEWLNSSSSYYKSIAEWAKDRPMAVQGMIFSVMNWGNYDCPGGKLLDPVEESKDDLSLIKALAKNCRAAFSGKYKARWDSQAQLCNDIIDGKITEEQLKEWIETKNISGVSPGYGEEVEYSGWD